MSGRREKAVVQAAPAVRTRPRRRPSSTARLLLLLGHVLAILAGTGMATALPPEQGPGGPILVITSAANPFSGYYAEILRAEGLNAFAVADIAAVSAATLDAYDVVILGEMSPSAAQVAMLTTWVTGGGNLIAMRPNSQLASLLGLTSAGGTLSNAYLLVNTAAAPGAGIVNQTIQFHGTADRYTLSGAAAVATLYATAATATANPAVTLRSVGGNGGQAASFTYDLARSVVYTRQGNPAWAGQERDGVTPKRSDDLFYGAASGDPQPDWIDLNKVAIPQADEQQRLLANLILAMNLDRKPLPRFWYLPRGLKAAVIMTGDQHGCCEGTRQRFDIYANQQSPPGCSVDNWECVRASSYIYSSSDMDDAEALWWTNLGFDLGVHVNTGCADWTPSSLASDFSSQLATFASLYPSVPDPSTNRTHCIAWSDWATQASVSLSNGIRLDTNYYYWPPSWLQNRPGMFTGSGMPMRFAALNGAMIDVYQAVTQMTDESGQSFPFTINALLDNAIGPNGYYGAFTANMHTDTGNHPESNAIVASAQERGVPVVSGRQMLTWLDGRNGSSFGSVSWSGDTLSFTIAVAPGANNLRAMLPTASAQGPLVSITRDGNPVAFTMETIKGLGYAFFPATAGSYAAAYQVPPTPTHTATRTSTTTATATHTSTSTPTATATATSINTATATPINTATATHTGTATATRTGTATATRTGTATATRTGTATATRTGTASATPTATVTSINTPTATVTPLNTPSVTPTGTVTPTVTPTATSTPSVTPSVTPTATVTPPPSGTPVATPTTIVPLDHFTCYKTKTTTGAARFMAVAGVSLVDQFGASSVEVRKPKMLCAPTDTNGADPDAPTHAVHLEDYQIKRASLFTAVRNQRVTDQFGTLTLDLKKPTTLQVPAAKSLRVMPPPPANPGVDHFQCYKVGVSRGTPRFTVVNGATLVDQFGALTVDVRKPRRLCAPVNKNNEAPGAETHPQYLLCYQVRQTSQPPFTTVSPLFVADQFGPQTLDARKLAELCVPATMNP